MAKEAEKKRRYGNYYTKIKGKIFGVARIRQPDGKYKKKLKLCENKTEAQNWALNYIAEYKNSRTFNIKAFYARRYFHLSGSIQ